MYDVTYEEILERMLARVFQNGITVDYKRKLANLSVLCAGR